MATKTPKKIIIVGAGENGYVIKGILAHNREVQVIGFLDDMKVGKDILGKVSDFEKYQKEGYHFFVSIGTNSSRKKVFVNLKRSGAKFINAIHPSAFVEPNVKLGTNIMVGAQSYVNVGSTVGNNTFINNGCTVEHDNKIGSHCHLAPGAVTGGGVKIGDETFVGLNCTIRDHITVGERTVIGMGSAVVKNVPSDVVALGCPAKIIKHLK